MATNSINWVGNRVVDQNSSRTQTRSSISDYSPPAYEMPSTTSASGDPLSSMSQPLTQQGPPPVADKGYIPYYLASNIGRNVRAEFILGNSQYVDKSGKLIEVGINYFVLEDVNSRTHIMCDLYSVRFVTILMDNSSRSI